MINFSILLPTRGRPSLLYRLLDSIVKTTHDINAIEVIIYMDDDDTASHAVTSAMLKIIKLIRPRGSSMGMISNKCYEASSGRYIMLMNDDVVFRSQGWDVSVLEAFSKFPDDIALVYGNDLDLGEKIPTFPILTRRTCEIMGGICPAGYMNLYIDSHILDIFRRLKRNGHNRIVYLKDIIFEHLHYETGKSQYDETYIKKNLASDDWLFMSLDGEREHTAKKLSSYIENPEDYKSRHPDEKTCMENNSLNAEGPDVSIIIPDISLSPGNISRCLDAILSGGNTATFEVIAACSNPDSSKHLSAIYSDRQLRFIHLNENLRTAEICNYLAKEASGSFLVFLSIQSIPVPGWIDALINAVKMGEDIAVVGCKHVNPRNGRTQHAGISFYNEMGEVKATYIYRGLRSGNPVVNKVREFQSVSWNGMLVERNTFWGVGGFDDSLNYMGDINFCLKIRERGMTIIYTPAAVIYYDGDIPYGGALTGLNNSPESLHLLNNAKSDLDEFLEEDGFYRYKKGDIFFIREDDTLKDGSVV